MLAFLLAVTLPQGPAPIDLDALFAAAPSMATHAAILKDRAEHRLQILVAVPVTGEDGRTTLVRSRLGDAAQYFYPASSIKLCGAVALLLELSRLNAERDTAHGLHSEWRIGTRFDGDVVFDRDASNLDGGRATIRHDLRKLLLVSDNLAYNHCLEVLGADRINTAMWAAGMRSTRLWHRLAEAHTVEENMQTRPVTLRTGEVVTELPARAAAVELSNADFTELQLGTGHLIDGELVAGPMSFAQKNAISLEDLQDVLVEVVRPEIDTGKVGFPGLTLEQRRFFVSTLGELPRESANPQFDPEQVPDHACKWILRGVRRVIPAEHVRVYDKIGRAYGFTVENAYVEDTRTGRGFFFAMVLYSNPDGVLNDDRYGYAEIAEPFFDDVGEVVARSVFSSTR